MSGIAGIFTLDRQLAEPDDLRKMLDALIHRGPDGSHTWCDGPVGLGHQMLWTTPESLLEKLPVAKKALTITADARIDNRDELIAELNFERYPTEKLTDSDIILAAYEKWGERCPERLLGDFAFAIWDRASQRLFCARDHFGIKPFYYYHCPDAVFVFASEIKALLSLSAVPQQLNQVRLGDYLTLTMADTAITTFEHILRLPPAHTLSVTQPQVDLQRYWQLDPQQELSLPSDQAYAQAFHDIFTEAVRCRLRSAFPIASQLSGGLDSSSVTCVARKLLLAEATRPLQTISVVFDTVTECDERPFIEAVLAGGNLLPHYIQGDGTSPLADIETIFQYEDEAYIGPSHFYPWIANRAAHQLGVRIVLDGFDGDTTVSHGVARLGELAYQGRWKELVRECEAIAQVHQISSRHYIQNELPQLHRLLKRGKWVAFAQTVRLLHRHFGVSRRQLIVKYGLQSYLKSIWRQLWKSSDFTKASTDLPSSNPLVHPDFAKSIGLWERAQANSLRGDPPHSLRQSHWQELTQGILPFTLEQVDRYAASFSLEARHPFMDKRLIEFCLALPAEQKLSRGFGRVVMRRALSGILPELVQWRPGKADLSPNFDYGFLNRDRKILNEVMSNKVKYLEKIINLDVLQAAYQRMTSLPTKTNDDDCITVWIAVILTLSLEHKGLLPQRSVLADSSENKR